MRITVRECEGENKGPKQHFSWLDWVLDAADSVSDAELHRIERTLLAGKLYRMAAAVGVYYDIERSAA